MSARVKCQLAIETIVEVLTSNVRNCTLAVVADMASMIVSLSRAYLGLTTPGVSNRTTCLVSSVHAPSIGTLVVLVFLETAETCV